jgi:lipocalin
LIRFVFFSSHASAAGPVKVYNGSAINSQFSQEPGQFHLTLSSGFDQNYWILALGRKEDSPDGLYPWVIVSDEIQGVLFISARNVSEFNARYKHHVLQMANDKGFDMPTNSPIETYQDEKRCKYKPMDEEFKRRGK